MIQPTREEDIQQAYDRVLKHCQTKAGIPEYMLQQSGDYAGGMWKAYRVMLASIPLDLEGKTVVDFGCKFGHLLPLLHALGCSGAIGVDAHDEYVRLGDSVFSALFSGARVVKTEQGYIPLQPASVDLIIMNEVISHVNPTYLDTVWREAGRILRPEGMLFISDGNNVLHLESQAGLIDLYEKWENGPDGARTDRDTVHRPFRHRRIELIRQRHPQLELNKVEELADNTSGLFGEYFFTVVDEYVKGGELVRRPYRRGTCPVNPEAGGYVMERSFDPEHLKHSLREYGFEAHQVVAESFRFTRSGILGRARDLISYARSCAGRFRHRRSEGALSAGFQIVARKTA